MKKIYVGIDISKDKFDVYAKTEQNQVLLSRKFSYQTTEDIDKFVATLSADKHCCVMEATGVYHKRLAYALVDAGIDTCVVNPASIKFFSKMKNSITKTDKQDAKIIAEYGQQQQPVLYEKPTEKQDELAQRRSLLEALQKQLQMLKNHREALLHQPHKDIVTQEMLEQQIAFLEQQIQQLKQSIEQCSKELHGHKSKLLQTIPGIGPQTATALLCALDGFNGIELPNAHKAFCKYLGLVPTIFESGKSVKKSQHIGRSSVPSCRQTLYIATCACINHSKQKHSITNFFQQLVQNGKTFKQSIIATMHKIVRVALAVLDNNMPFDPLWKLSAK